MDLNAQDAEGNTPLHLALESGQEVVSMLLMQHGADVTASNSFGRTPLHFAALQGMEQVNFDASSRDPLSSQPLLAAR